jgi:ubiquitin-protein ligase
LDSPNVQSPAQIIAFELYVKNRKKYNEKILEIAKNSKPKE